MRDLELAIQENKDALVAVEQYIRSGDENALAASLKMLVSKSTPPTATATPHSLDSPQSSENARMSVSHL
jgi:hypothetical protein